MPLTGKYLKYSPEITLEIFTLVWNKLIDSGINAQQGNDSVEREYAHFSSKFSFLRLEYTGLFGAYTRTHDCKETTVQEILGYNPFKDDFVLPEKWKVKINNSNSDIISKYLKTLPYVKLGYDIYGFLISNPGDGSYLHYGDASSYTEITFEQFQKYVLNTEQPKVMETKVESKEVIPEYAECIFGYEGQFTKGKIYKLTPTKSIYQYEVENCDNGLRNAWMKQHFKPSTKEAFDAQNQPKSIEKWSAGSYIVALNDKLNSHSSVNITVGSIYILLNPGLSFNDNNGNYIYALKKDECNFKWFATLHEAEEFAKTLVEPVKEEVKQPLKQAVHCKTQEEWDFVTEKLGYKWVGSDWYGENCYINTQEKETANKSLWVSKGYQILSFQEWCDLNGYKMEKEVKFKVGDWVIITKSNQNWNDCMDCYVGKVVKITSISSSTSIEFEDRKHWSFLAINGHFRHATPIEINNHLISIGQIPDLIKQESEKYPFKPLKPGDLEWEIQVPQIKTYGIMWCEPAPMTKDNWKHKMILSIDDEELPMVSVIKTNSIKQLLNND